MPPEMSNKEAIDMMIRAIADIQDLRAEIDRLRPKAEAYDNIAIVLGLLPKGSMYAKEDLVWCMQQRIKELEAKKPE